MPNKIQRLFAAILLLASSHEAQALSFPVSADTYVQTTAPANNYGTNALIRVSPSQRGYIRFNLGNLPPEAAITKAWLRLWVSNVAQTKNGVLEILNLTTDWNEIQLSANNQPMLDPTRVGALVVHPEDKGHYINSSDISQIVNNWRSGAVTNLGLAILSDSAFPINVQFDSKESTGTSHPIELVMLTEGVPGQQGNPGVQGNQGPPGNPGLPGSPSGLTWISHVQFVGRSNTAKIFQDCPPGGQAYSGGATADMKGVTVYESAPSGDRQRWYVSVQTADDDAYVRVYALCGLPYQ